ncbi:MAG: hypothetical protein QNJ68_19615 [Microcoleaceae cyanobacterium MO_207.B10]|nr:hypothetical protein [Microcoleaceae cyanobacterium MO_207.B10]
MSNKDGFTSGLIAGAAVGGLVGGLLGILLGSKLSEENDIEENLLDEQNTEGQKVTREVAGIEEAHQSLEGKIAQLNQAIDDVRQQIAGVNGNLEKTERSLSEDS